MRPLFHPSPDSFRADAILHALADPERAAIFAGIAGVECLQRCSQLADAGERVIPKSSLSQHFKILREAGLPDGVINLIYEFLLQLKAGHDFRYIK